MTPTELPRRTFLVSGAAAAGGLLLSSAGPQLAAEAAPGVSGTWSSGTTENGWPVLRRPGTHAVQGSGQDIRLASEAAALLVYDQLRPGDLVGHTVERTVEQDYESNHLSGTALSIRALAYPAGVHGGFFPAEQAVVEDILAELDGAVSWGGHFGQPKESHFQIAHRPGHRDLERAVRRVADVSRRSASGAAGATDAFAPQRRRRSLDHRASR